MVVFVDVMVVVEDTVAVEDARLVTVVVRPGAVEVMMMGSWVVITVAVDVMVDAEAVDVTVLGGAVVVSVEVTAGAVAVEVANEVTVFVLPCAPA
jgi:hypothetical protein